MIAETLFVDGVGVFLCRTWRWWWGWTFFISCRQFSGGRRQRGIQTVLVVQIIFKFRQWISPVCKLRVLQLRGGAAVAFEANGCAVERWEDVVHDTTLTRISKRRNRKYNFKNILQYLKLFYILYKMSWIEYHDPSAIRALVYMYGRITSPKLKRCQIMIQK